MTVGTGWVPAIAGDAGRKAKDGAVSVSRAEQAAIRAAAAGSAARTWGEIFR